MAIQTVTDSWQQVTLSAGSYTAIQNKTNVTILVCLDTITPTGNEGFELERLDAFSFEHDGRSMYVKTYLPSTQSSISVM